MDRRMADRKVANDGMFDRPALDDTAYRDMSDHRMVGGGGVADDGMDRFSMGSCMAGLREDDQGGYASEQPCQTLQLPATLPHISAPNASLPVVNTR